MTARWPDEHGRWVALVSIVLYAGLASLSRPLTDAAAVAVAIPCVVVLLRAGLPRAPVDSADTRPSVRRATVAWGTVLALAAAWELVAWMQQPAYNVASHDHPTVSILLDPVIEPLAPRFVAWCCWLYLGYRLLRR